MKEYARSKDIIRKSVELPDAIAKLLRAAGVEHSAPEDVGGLLFGCIAHLSASIHKQFPEHWPMFKRSFIEATDELRDVLMSADPSGEVAETMAKQRRIRQAMEKPKPADAVDPQAVNQD
jgi:hypothetical protein